MRTRHSLGNWNVFGNAVRAMQVNTLSSALEGHPSSAASLQVLCRCISTNATAIKTSLLKRQLWLEFDVYTRSTRHTHVFTESQNCALKQSPGVWEAAPGSGCPGGARASSWLGCEVQGEKKQRKGSDPRGEQGGNPLKRTGTHWWLICCAWSPAQRAREARSPAAAFQGFLHDSRRRERSPKTSTPPAGASAEAPRALSVKHCSRTRGELVPNWQRPEKGSGERGRERGRARHPGHPGLQHPGQIDRQSPPHTDTPCPGQPLSSWASRYPVPDCPLS